MLGADPVLLVLVFYRQQGDFLAALAAYDAGMDGIRHETLLKSKLGIRQSIPNFIFFVFAETQ